jgi:hypothetical protein
VNVGLTASGAKSVNTPGLTVPVNGLPLMTITGTSASGTATASVEIKPAGTNHWQIIQNTSGSLATSTLTWSFASGAVQVISNLSASGNDNETFDWIAGNEKNCLFVSTGTFNNGNCLSDAVVAQSYTTTFKTPQPVTPAFGSFYVQSNSDSGNASMTTDIEVCDVPTGETIELVNPNKPWDQSTPTLLDFKQTLYPNGSSYQYDHVQETVAQTSQDTCYFPQSKVGKVTGFRPAPPWPVLAGGVWEPDQVGWNNGNITGLNVNVIQYYRQNNRAPCKVVNFQQMQFIGCPAGPVNYGPVHNLTIIIGKDTITSTKTGVDPATHRPVLEGATKRY